MIQNDIETLVVDSTAEWHFLCSGKTEGQSTNWDINFEDRSWLYLLGNLGPRGSKGKFPKSLPGEQASATPYDSLGVIEFWVTRRRGMETWGLEFHTLSP